MPKAKRFLSKALALIMVAGMGTTAFATTDSTLFNLNGPQIDLEVITSNLTYEAINSSKYDKIEIGNYMPAYVWDGTDLVSSEEEVLFYPIYGDNEIAAILTMFNPYGDQSYTVSIDFANELNAAIGDAAQNCFIVEAGSKLYVGHGDQGTLLKEYPAPTPVNAQELQTRSTVTGAGPQADGQPTVTSDLNISYEDSNTLTLSELNSYIANNDIEDTSNFRTDSSNKDNRIDITPSEAQTRTMRWLPTQVLNQGSTEYCTYFASTIIGNYLTDRSVSPHTVMDWYGDYFGNIIGAQNVINDYFGENYSYIDDIYGRAAGEFISLGYPLYAAFYNAEVTLGHAMAVTGYDDAGNSGIGVVETLGGYKKVIYPSSASTYITRAYNQNCYWSDTLYYQYW